MDESEKVIERMITVMKRRRRMAVTKDADVFIRSKKAVVRELKKYEALLWYGRHVAQTDEQKAKWEPDIRAGAEKAAREVEKKYPKEELIQRGVSDFDWGMISGKVSTLRWLIGGQWDELDS
jgi:hypothetical protein